MSYYYDENFYNEPNEFDILMSDFKEALLKSIKDEYVGEMEKLRAENLELQAVKKDFEAIKKEYELKKLALERERNGIERAVRRERLVDLSKDHKVTMYRDKRELLPKCETCDVHRQVPYVTPLGREAREDCLCRQGKIVYYPKEYVRYEFRINRNRNGLTAWYRQYSDDEDGLVMDSSIFAEDIYSPEMKFEDIKQYSTFFKSKEECQLYCDYLNKEE